MGYFRISDLLAEQSEQIEQFRDRIGVPEISQHAELRYAQRVVGLDLTRAELLSIPGLRSRCRRGILRNFDEADEVIASVDDDDVHHVFRRNRCLVMKRKQVITVYNMKATGGELAFRKKRLRRGRLPGIETFEALRARRSA
jgi:hypothetical protein